MGLLGNIKSGISSAVKSIVSKISPSKPKGSTPQTAVTRFQTTPSQPSTSSQISNVGKGNQGVIPVLPSENPTGATSTKSGAIIYTIQSEDIASANIEAEVLGKAYQSGELAKGIIVAPTGTFKSQVQNSTKETNLSGWRNTIKENLIVASEKRPLSISKTIMPVTQEEANILSKSGFGDYYVPKGDLGEVGDKARFMAGLPLASTFNFGGLARSGITETSFIKNRAMIISAENKYNEMKQIVKGLPEGTEVSFLPSFFTIDKTSYQQAQQQFTNLPAITRSGMKATGISTGILQGVYGTSEFGIQALGEISNMQAVDRKHLYYSSTSFEGQIFNSPIGKQEMIGRGIVIAPMLLGAGSSIIQGFKAGGTIEALGRTANMFSPINIKPKIYTPQIIEDVSKFEMIGFKSGSKTIFGGRVAEEPIKITGFKSEFSGGLKSSGAYFTESPFVEVTSGGQITSGVRRTSNIFVQKSIPAESGMFMKGKFGSVSENIMSGISKETQLKVGDVYTGISERGMIKETGFINVQKAIKTTSGSISKQMSEGVTFIRGGKAIPQYKTFISGYNTAGKISDWTYAPTGKYKVSPNLKMIEFNIGELKGFNAGEIGTGQLKSIQKLKTSYPSFDLKSPQITKTKQITPLVTPFKLPNQKVISTSQILKSEGIQTTSQKQTQFNRFKLDELMITREKTRTGVIPYSSTITSQTTSQKQTPFFVPVQQQKIIEFQEQRNKQINIINPNPNTKGYGFNFDIPPIIPPHIKIPLGFGEIGGSNKRFGGKKRVSYQPSFSAFVFKIGGKYKAGKLGKSGINFRPITSGWSVSKRKKLLGGLKL